MLEATQTRLHDADGVVEFLARSKGAEITILLRELGPNETRVSIRTAGDVNAATLAATYGGGGHARRAGCTIGMPCRAPSSMSWGPLTQPCVDGRPPSGAHA